MLAHYGAVALPCRVRDPDRKGKIERGVGHAKNTPQAMGPNCAAARNQAALLRAPTEIHDRRSGAVYGAASTNAYREVDRLRLGALLDREKNGGSMLPPLGRNCLRSLVDLEDSNSRPPLSLHLSGIADATDVAKPKATVLCGGRRAIDKYDSPFHNFVHH